MRLIQAAKQERERAYLLAKVRAMVDAALVIDKCSSGDCTREEALRKRLRAAPAYLRQRVELGEELPEVEVRPGGEGADEGDEKKEEVKGEGGTSYKEEVLMAVAKFVMTELKDELVVELLRALRPRWS